MDKMYVIGHVNPDTDSIAAEMGYAWCLQERDGVEAVAARAGAYNPQTTWLLKKLELDGPILMTDASPRFESVHQSMHLQAQGAQHIHQAMMLLNETAHHTADSIRQSNAAIERLNNAAHNLQNGVTKFKVRKESD